MSDSKNAYDAQNRIERSGLQMEEKRKTVELLGITERVTDGFVDTRWVDSDQELAHGFAHEQLLKALSLGRWSIHFSPEFVSAKRKRHMLRSLLCDIKTPELSQHHIFDRCRFIAD